MTTIHHSDMFLHSIYCITLIFSPFVNLSIGGCDKHIPRLLCFKHQRCRSWSFSIFKLENQHVNIFGNINIIVMECYIRDLRFLDDFRIRVNVEFGVC